MKIDILLNISISSMYSYFERITCQLWPIGTYLVVEILIMLVIEYVNGILKTIPESSALEIRSLVRELRTTDKQTHSFYTEVKNELNC